MNVLNVPYFSVARYNDPANVLEGIFATLDANKVTYEPWPTGGLKPQVDFKIFYGDDAVFLNFSTREKYFRATYKEINDPVYKDSCVEFFIGFEGDDGYYNFEFNALGTPLLGYGTGKERELADALLVNQIKRNAIIKTEPDDNLMHHWELTVAIHFDAFFKHQITTLNGLHCRGNFYKCGDELPEPHYLCWSNIVADEPNYHLPAYFGAIDFD